MHRSQVLLASFPFDISLSFNAPFFHICKSVHKNSMYACFFCALHFSVPLSMFSSGAAVSSDPVPFPYFSPLSRSTPCLSHSARFQRRPAIALPLRSGPSRLSRSLRLASLLFPFSPQSSASENLHRFSSSPRLETGEPAVVVISLSGDTKPAGCRWWLRFPGPASPPVARVDRRRIPSPPISVLPELLVFFSSALFLPPFCLNFFTASPRPLRRSPLGGEALPRPASLRRFRDCRKRVKMLPLRGRARLPSASPASRGWLSGFRTVCLAVEGNPGGGYDTRWWSSKFSAAAEVVGSTGSVSLSLLSRLMCVASLPRPRPNEDGKARLSPPEKGPTRRSRERDLQLFEVPESVKADAFESVPPASALTPSAFGAATRVAGDTTLSSSSPRQDS